MSKLDYPPQGWWEENYERIYGMKRLIEIRKRDRDLLDRKFKEYSDSRDWEQNKERDKS